MQKKNRQITSMVMAIVMTATTTFQMPSVSLATEMESSTVAVESQIEETTVQATEAETAQTVLESSSSNEQVDELSVASTEAQATEETTAEVTYEEEETSLPAEVDPSGEDTTETSANETRGPDEEEGTTEVETEIFEESSSEESSEESSSEEPTITLSSETTKEEILSYIEAIGGNESDAFYAFIGSLGEDEYQLVWMAQYGAEEDQLAEKFDFDYDDSSDLDVAKYIHKLSEDELIDFVESMTFEQYRRYISIKEMMAEMDEKDFSDVIDEEEFEADRTWDYESYDAFAESVTGVSLQRTEQTMQFYNTYVDPSQVEAGVTTIDGLLNSNADWYSDDYILSLNPEMFKETVPIYHGSDGNYYVVSTVPSLNGIESADYQPATNFYNGSVEAQAFTDIEYLGNGVYRIPNSRYKYCFTEQYVSDMGTMYGVSFGLRIQVLYGFTPSGEITIAADVLYPDMTERFLPATLNLLAGTATVRIFNDDYDDSVDNYLVSASINRGANLPESAGSLDNGKTLQFVVNDASAVGSFDVLIGYNATSKYSMAAEITTQDLYGSQSGDVDISLAAELYNGTSLKLSQSSVPKNLAVGDKFVYESTQLTIVGVNTTYDGKGDAHIGATTVPTHDAQSFCFYNPEGSEALTKVSTWFKTELNTTSADPGYMVQMTATNIDRRASWNGTSVNLGNNKIFGYVTDGLSTVKTSDGKVLNLEGTQVLLSCMHAWGNESAETPREIITSIGKFTGREDLAEDTGYGHYKPNVALQCTSIEKRSDGYTYATFKVVTSMLEVRGVVNAKNYQCAFSTLNIAYPTPPSTGYLRIHKESSNTTLTANNSCYKFEGITYKVYSDSACKTEVATLTLNKDGYSDAVELTEGTYYIKETNAANSGYALDTTAHEVKVTAGTTSDAPQTWDTKDAPLGDPLGIRIEKINSDGTTVADLSGAEYTITYYPKAYDSVADIQKDSSAKPTKWVIKTIKNANGNYHAYLDDAHIVSGSGSAGAVFGKDSSGSYIIPLGTITVQETKAPAGFTTDGATVSDAKNGKAISGTNGVYLFKLVDDKSSVYLKSGNALSNKVEDETSVTLKYAEVQNKAGIRITKYDATTNGAATGEADLSGIKFAIVNKTGADIVNYAGNTIKNGEVVQVITTNSDGYAATGATDLPIGSYLVKELRKDATFNGKDFTEGSSALANDYYEWKDNQDTVVLKDENAGTLVWAKTFYDNPLSAVPVMEKYDFELNKKAAMGGTSFAGITFEIYNGSENSVVVGGKIYEKDAVITTAVSDAEGNIQLTEGISFPIGSYYVKEKSVNDQYNMTDGDAHKFFVKNVNGKATVTYENGASSVVFTNRVVRGELSFMKRTAGDFKALAYIPFKITNNATGETHYVLTDEKGNFSSSSVKKTTNTNANDETLSTYGEDDVIPQSVIDSLEKDAGVWFGLGSDGTTMTTANDLYGSFVYGTYTITELRTESTKNMREMYKDTFSITEEAKTLDLETISNVPMGITTTLVTVEGSHYASATNSVKLIDHVSYKNLDTTKTYTLTGYLYKKDKTTVSTFKKETITFQPKEENGTVDVTFTFDASELKGKAIFAVEQLTLDGKFCAEHADSKDLNQAVFFPDVQTTALDNTTNAHVSAANDSITITDTITYSGLCAGETYRVVGTLIDKATGKAIEVGGNKVTAEATFVPEKTTGNTYVDYEASGTVDITFTFNASALEGTVLVAYEKIYKGTEVVASHEDSTDENQTVYLPKISTSAKDKATGLNQIQAKEATLVDTVSYSSLPSLEYTLTGVLMNAATGEELKINGKSVTASTTFTPDKTSGSVDVTFNFDASSLAGTTIVVYETLTYKGKTIATHKDLKDSNQTVYVPGLQTTAVGADTNDHFTMASKKITLVDTVTYSNLEVGREYTVKGVLMDKATNASVKVGGKEVTAETTFTPTTANGTVDTTFTFDGTGLEDHTFVVFETLYAAGNIVATHADISDDGQTVYVPKISTSAKDKATGLNQIQAKAATIVDTVSYSSLPSREYTVTGVLMNAETGEEIKVNGKSVTASTTFTPSKMNGSVDVTFNFDASSLAGTTIVVYEILTYKGTEVATHKDLKDAKQTIYVPGLQTTAVGADTSDHLTMANKKITLVDTVKYSNLEVGREYTVKGVLMDKATKKALQVGGKEVTAEATFTPTTKNGTVDVTFTFDGTGLEDHTLVVFETLYTQGTQVAAHTDIDDVDQTVSIPKIGTTATDLTTGINHTEAKPKATIVDAVAYSSLVAGKEYTVTGVLMNQSTNKPVLVDGKQVTASTTFTAKSSKGIVNVTFEFDASALEGITTVVFESLKYKNVEVATHADINDTNQTIYIPKVRTTAVNKVTNDHAASASLNTTIVDTISYSGLEVGKEYEVQGVLMNRKTKKPIEVNGKQVTASATFTAKAATGSIDLTFEFDASALSGTILVAFETLYTAGKEVATHADINDEDQTIYFLGIETTAKDNATRLNQMEAMKNATLIDTVSYTALLPNREYVLSGVLMNKATGKAVEVNGKQITAKTTFTPKTADGTVDVVFDFDASAVEGITTVVYEYLSYKGAILASHTDIDDAGQTVYIPKIRTNAISVDTQDHVTKPSKEMHLVDTVSYTGLEVGREYQLQAVLMDQETNKAIQVAGKNVTSSVTFTPEETNGTVNVYFDFDGSALTSNALVVFETMYTEGKKVATHADINDEDQTINIIGIQTHARDFFTQTNHTESANEAQIVDHVEYTGVLPNQEYMLYGVLMNKATGKPLLINGQKVIATTVFTPTEKTGTTDVVFKFDASAIEGTAVVVFETLTYRGIEVASHQDIDDVEQTVYIPSVKTTAISGDTKDHMTTAKGEVEITDTVSYKGLEVGRSYVLKGVLMNRNTKVPISVDGKNVVAETTFTAEKAEGTIDVTFKFDGSKLKNTIFVAFETLYVDGKEVASHTDLSDEDQTIYVPEIHTSAKDAVTEINHTEAQKVAKIVDTVSYSSLQPGKEYTLTGTLMNKATGKAIEVGGKQITASKTFTPTKSNGTVEVTFEFDASVLEGSTVVVFERLTHKGIEVATHEDITDTNQTVYIPKVRTTAVSDDTKDHITGASEKIHLTDTVTYSNLETGRNYELRATLMDQATGKAITVNGKEVTAFTSFTPDKADGTVDVTFIFDGTGLEDRVFVVFERLYAQGKEVAAHADINDTNQSIYIPKIRTTATDPEGTTNHIEAKKEATIVDTVSYSSLLPGKEYTLTGTLMNKTTGKPILVDGKEITASKTFTPTESKGTVDVTFTFDASALEGTTIVAFEQLLYKGIEVAIHADITDKKQTVYVPKIRTTAISADTKDHVSIAGEKITLVDTVSFESLQIGRTYQVSGVLMDRDTKKPLLDASGKEITSSAEFIAKSNDGTVDVTFTFAGTSLASKTIVAYETLYTEGKQVATHTDINDEEQALYIPTIKTKALDANTGLNQIHEDTNATIVDTVSYDHLLPGRTYVIKGILMNSAGNALQIDGKPITTSAEFTPKTASGTAEVVFSFDASEIGGRKIVVFEYLYLNDVLLASHTDIEDDNQTLYIPDIKTTIQDGENGSHSSTADEEITLVDTVTYKGLEIGRTYSMEGTLVDKSTGAYILDDAGNKITASTEFTAKKANGTVDVVFKFSGASLAGKIVVAYERLYTEGIEVAAHTNLRDEGQTQYIPSVHTTAIAKDTQDHVTGANEEVTITDEVVLEGLKSGVEYVVRGTLMNAETGQAIIVNARTVTVERTFTADANKMTIPLTYTLNASELAGTTTVVFENLYSDGILLASHTDLTDAEQTVYIPKIHTTAKDKITGINHTESAKTATIIDTVFYTNLFPNRSYVVSGKLMNKATGEPILIGGKEVTASTTFTPTKAEGSVDVTFTFDATAVAPETVVVFENLTYKDIELAVHAEIEDADQTVYIPTIKTSAIGDDTKDHVTEAKKDVTIVDTVSYEGLEVGREYTVKGVLMNKATGKAILVNGKEVTAESTFVAKAQKGTVDVTFKFDGSSLEDTLLVAFETLYTENKEVGVHADIKDDAQTVYLPKIRTNAEDAVTEINHTEAKPKAKIIDTVTYSSLLLGKEYTLTGTLMNKATGKPILLNGKEITASTTFKAEKSSGSVQVVFEFDASVLEGTTVVAYESMTYKGVEVAIHADITDKDQTVYIPKVRTTAIGSDTKDHVTEAKKDVTIVDTVSYEGLEVGREYTVKGVLMNKATGKAITVNGKEVTAESTFVAKAQKGTVDVTFKFDGSSLEDTLLVAFETLYTENKEVGVHADIKDDAQTVYLPKIRTNAEDAVTEINHTEAKPKAKIIDTVSYSSLLPGKEYTLTGTLMNKATGKAILLNGKEITASTTFKAEKSSGSVQVVFEFDASVLEGTTVVAYESMTYKGVEVAIHADITDKDQTVYIPKVRTTAIGSDTKDHVTEAKKDVTIIDTVSYEGLEVGREYTVKGVLMNKATGKAILVNGKEVTAESTFTAKAQKGTVDVTFKFDGSSLEDTLLVAFETLYTEEKEVGVHADIKDDAQTVYLPKIRTNAEDGITKINHTEAKPKATIVDSVKYSSLLPGKEYVLHGVLMDKNTGKPILLDGKEITAETTFTPKTSSGSVDVVFEFDASVLEGTTVVAYESMTYKGVEVAIHADITDKDQTVYIPKVRTTAIGSDTKDHVTEAKKDVTIVDTVSYEGLEVGREYTVKGVLMNKATGKAITVNGKEVTAESTFVAKAQKGTVDVTFKFDGSSLEDTLLVAFETLYTENKEVGVHADIKDDAQTVYLPKIRTHAKDATTEIDHTEALEKATIIDTVTYSSLLPGKEYTIKGTLMNKETGEAVLINGEPITAETTFTAEKSSGSVDLIFTFDASAIAGTTVVAFEHLEYKGIEVGVHADITDEDQTVYIPDVHTTATALDTEDHVTKANEEVTITDEVALTGLKVGSEYTVKGVLMDQTTGKELKVNDENITAEVTFTADERDMTVTLTYTLDASKLAGTTTVVYETLYTEGKEVGKHHEIKDEGQTVYIPEIHTTAEDLETKINHTEAKDQATIVDTVLYSHLLPGKEYTVKGTLMNKATGEPILINDEPITAETTFTPETPDGSVDVVFEFDATAVVPTTIVAFEHLEYKGIEVAVHADITDKDQTVYVPSIHTTAVGEDTKDHVTGAKEETTIVDTVAYKGLEIGREYRLEGTLMDQETGEPLLINDEKVTAETIFTPEEQDGSVDVIFTFNTSALAGKTLVVFETLYADEKEVAVHAEITDEGQTVYIPEIRTTAADKETEINHTEAKEATIIDTVLYTHLLPGKEYTVKGTLMNKATGEPILIDGKEVTAETTFTAEKADGSVDVIFTFDASKIAGTTIVAFETLEYQGIEVAAHADIEDKDQTVYVPDIHTTAVGKDTKDHIEKAMEEAVIVDTVAYKGLEVGREYTVKGTLMDKETGEPLVINEEEVVAETTFTPETTDGSVDVIFTFDASALAGKTYVAFETLYTEDREVAIHTDIEDEDQTVFIPDVYTTATDKVTGDHDGVVAEETTVLDEVFYKNLIPGKEYTVNGKLMVKETGEPLTVNGEEVTASKTFTAEEADGSVILEFTFNSLALAGKHVVAFEDLTYEGISIASHEDLEDEDQTISYPELHTNAADQASGSKTMTVGTNVTLVDTVTYKGLTKDKTYIVKGTIMDKASGQPIGVTAEATFTAEETDGSVVVTFTFDTGLLQGKTLVVFEELYDEDGNKIIAHNDLNDADQTVTVPAKPEVPPVVTGDDSTPMPYVAALIALLLAAAAVVLVLVKRRKQQA